MKSLTERFMSKVRKDVSGHWFWIGAKNNAGYGHIRDGDNFSLSHRVSWVISRGEIPLNLCVLHKCDIPSCVNPDHLFVGTLKENTQDMMKKARNRVVLPETPPNSKLTKNQVREIRSKYQPYKHGQLVEFATEYGVSRWTIAEVIYHQTWMGV